MRVYDTTLQLDIFLRDFMFFKKYYTIKKQINNYNSYVYRYV